MKAAAFNALSTVETSGIQALGVGTYFFYGEDEARQANNIALRHKITYHVRIAGDGSLAGQGSLIQQKVFDILESDDTGAESKTATRPGVNRVVTRDDDDRLRYKTGDWS
jgi:hypothetical protein